MNKYFIILFGSIMLAGAAAWAGAPVVGGVGADTITVQGRTYKVPASAEIVVDGLASKLSDVHPGMVALISQGLDRDTAATITASTVPPAAPKQTTHTRSLFRPIGGNVIIAITSDRITYGVPGTGSAKAALITPQTRVYIDRARATDALGLSTGMPVEVATTDGVHADSIRADNSK